MKKLLFLLIACVIGIAAFAQSIDDQKKKIASIKKSNSYIYAEVTTTDRQQAIDLATDMLNNNINEWAAKKKKFAGSNKIVTRNTNYSVEQITMPRANMYRAFLYVKKTDIIPADNVEVRTTPAEVANTNNKAKASTSTYDNSTPRGRVINKLLTVQNTGQMSKVLKELKASGDITAYDNLKGLQGKTLSEYIMVIFNKDGVVEAVLSEGENRTNLKTGQIDPMSNYKGRGAIGVKVK